MAASPDTSPSPAITLVMPAWNEEKYIVPTLDSVDKAIAKFKRDRDLDVEVVVVDNDSTETFVGGQALEFEYGTGEVWLT